MRKRGKVVTMRCETGVVWIKIRRPPRSTLCPYTTLCRTVEADGGGPHRRRLAPLQGDHPAQGRAHRAVGVDDRVAQLDVVDRKSTRLNSSHANISYAVFCLKKKQQPHSLSLIHTFLSSTA